MLVVNCFMRNQDSINIDMHSLGTWMRFEKYVIKKFFLKISHKPRKYVGCSPRLWTVQYHIGRPPSPSRTKFHVAHDYIWITL